MEVFPGKKLMPWSGTPRLLRLEISCRHCLKRRHEGLSNSSLQIIFIQFLRPTVTSKINKITGKRTRHSKKSLDWIFVTYLTSRGIGSFQQSSERSSKLCWNDPRCWDWPCFIFCSFQSHIKYILMCKRKIVGILQLFLKTCFKVSSLIVKNDLSIISIWVGL